MKLSQLLGVVIGSAAASVLATSPAKALVFNVNGNSYDIVVKQTSYAADALLLEKQPWWGWGNDRLAADAAREVGNQLGSPNFFNLANLGYNGPSGPLFAQGLDLFTDGWYVSYTSWFGNVLNNGTWGFYGSSPIASNRYYAIVSTPVPIHNIPGGATIPSLATLLALGAMRKAKKSIASKTRIASRYSNGSLG
ncbi:MAG: hypothetical protein ACFKPT_26680 [Gloeotrichia echinulata GP01]